MFCLQLLHPHLGRGLILPMQRRCSIRRDIIQMHCVQVLVLAHITLYARSLPLNLTAWPYF
jgi:hypothetical protein